MIHPPQHPSDRHGAGIHVAHVVCSDGFAGVERYIATTALAMIERGVEVSVIGGRSSAMSAALKESGARFLPASSVAEAVAALRCVPRPNIVNTHMSEADIAGIAFATPRGIPVVSTRHFAARRGRKPLARAAFRLAAPRIRAQIAISRFVARAIGEPSTVVHTGVANVGASDVLARKPVMLLIQRLELEKDSDIAIRAWARSWAARAGWELHIVGDGSQRIRLEKLARDLGASDSVRFLGYCSDVGALMSRASGLLAPTSHEGLGIAVLEAMARALPVIASASGGHLETVGSVSDAWMFSPGDFAAAAELIDAALANPARYGGYGHQLQARQRAAFSVGAQVDKTLEVYERCTP
ncbi:Glycosyltransferase Family 4 [Paramicrobacterium humi]|uniref:Glycosyltransferase Family 4 n=1 Tax=Paramicrobacterium humi TaxID=640635 RepID=A0A1H4MKB6_9MICO|nr:glycosyltransferase [Microbacterium humi]SEB83449.1 Glycosyltransferase Family 4 [Microbacterium humi]